MTADLHNPNEIKVFIIDDNAIETLCIHEALESNGGALKIVEILPTTVGAMESITSLKPNVILLRVSSSDEANTLEFIRLMKDQFPDLPLVVITPDNTTATILTALKNGASSYMLNTTTPAQLKEAIIKTSQHGSVLSPEVARKVLTSLKSPPVIPYAASDRELEILKLVSKGFSNKEIGQKLFISTRTVETHLNHMYTRFDVSTRTQAVLHALRYQLFHLSDPGAANQTASNH